MTLGTSIGNDLKFICKEREFINLASSGMIRQINVLY